MSENAHPPLCREDDDDDKNDDELAWKRAVAKARKKPEMKSKKDGKRVRSVVKKSSSAEPMRVDEVYGAEEAVDAAFRDKEFQDYLQG